MRVAFRALSNVPQPRGIPRYAHEALDRVLMGRPTALCEGLVDWLDDATNDATEEAVRREEERLGR